METGFILITNAIRPFHRHNISILSLPPGGAYHFRYPRPYVSKELPRNIGGTPGLLILRNKVTGGFLPLRWCTGIRAEDYGEFIFFDFRFDRVFDGRPLAETQAWHTYQSTVEALLPKEAKNLPGEDLAPLVCPVSVSGLNQFGTSASDLTGEAASLDHVQRWLAMVSFIGQLEAYRHEHFYTVSRTYHEKASKSELCSYETLSPNRNGYRLVGNRVYFLEVIQVTVPFRKGKGPVEELILSSPAGQIQELRTSWTIDGPYDRARFPFYVVPQEASKTPSILILYKQRPPGKQDTETESTLAAVEPVSPAGCDIPPVPPTLLNLDIVWGAKRMFWKRVLPGTTVVLGIILFFAADWLAERWPFLGIPNATEDIRYCAIFGLAWAFNSLSSFVSSLKVTTKGQG